jgi:hypothetical protein
MAQIDIDYAGRSYTVPSTKENQNVLKELGVYAAQGRIEVLTLDGGRLRSKPRCRSDDPDSGLLHRLIGTLKRSGWWPSLVTCLKSASWSGRRRVNGWRGRRT